MQKLIEVIRSEIIKEICDLWGYKSHLEELRKTIFTIKNVLLDADAKRELTIEQQGYIRELKAAVYDSDDLFDQFLTLAELNQIDGNKVDSSCTMELVTKQFEEQLKGKKYILVLDDLWNEDRKKWVDLERFLKWGHVGSRILVTTRSNITTSVIGDKHALD